MSGAEEVHEFVDALGALARRMAGTDEPDEIVEVLTDAARRQCGADGAGVVALREADAEVIATSGLADLTRGRRFELAGSLVAEAIERRETLAIPDLTRSARPLARAAPDVQIGPVVVAPLIASDHVLGALFVVRAPGGREFNETEMRRLRVIADHAALALWKAELLERVQAADRAKGRFLATISHELRTPLTALTGYEELLADQVLGPLSESQVDVVERMRSVTHHLTTVIEDVLAFSSIEAGREVVRPTEFLAADLVQATAAVVEPLARQKSLSFSVSLPKEPIRLTSDVDKIRQILVNLTANAVKFTDKGEVRLELERRDGEVRFVVRDTGIGIAAGERKRLFRAFVQLDASLTRRHGGTGLGLYISQRLASALGGRIEVDSARGKGSTFTFVLPVSS